ncbi:class I SAM-dependent methyltransferase [soil metagenome]
MGERHQCQLIDVKYSPVFIAAKYLLYVIRAKNKKGHGIHSPFVFDFVTNVLNDKSLPENFKQIENIRKELLKKNDTINVTDYGAGGANPNETIEKKIKQIAATSLKSPKYAKLLYRIAKYYQPSNIVELGTSLGITTSYLAAAAANGKVYTLEGSASIAEIAKANFKRLALINIEQVTGPFESTYQPLLSGLNSLNLLFVDGNHREVPTLRYFELGMEKISPTSIFIFDDIQYSKEMESAWRAIQDHEAVRLSIDLFFIGIVFFNNDVKIKQHFEIMF